MNAKFPQPVTLKYYLPTSIIISQACYIQTTKKNTKLILIKPMPCIKLAKFTFDYKQ